MRAPAVLLQLVLAALLPTLHSQAGALRRRSGGALRATERAPGAQTTAPALSLEAGRMLTRCAFLRLCGCAAAVSRAACSPQVCEEQPGEVPGVNVSGGGSRCIPVRLCASAQQPFAAARLTSARAQIDPGSLTFCTSVSYVSCLRVPVPATYDKLVSDVCAPFSY